MAADETNPAETPAETSAEASGAQSGEKDTRPPELQAATSHLKNVSIPTADEDSDEETGKADTQEITLPKTLKASYKLLNEVQDFQPKTAVEARKKAAAITKLADHIHQLGQGHKIESISVEDHGELSDRTSMHAEEIHLADVCRHDKVVEKRILADAATIKALKAEIAAMKQPK